MRLQLSLSQTHRELGQTLARERELHLRVGFELSWRVAPAVRGRSRIPPPGESPHDRELRLLLPPLDPLPEDP